MQNIIEGGVCTGPAAPRSDGLTVFGPRGDAIIRDRIFDFRAVPHDEQDEVLSGVDGGVVTMERCVILGGIKAILAGNGDHPGNDMRYADWSLEDCVIIGAGRRCPEAQDGAYVTMRRCWIHDWGQTFDVRAFGAWAHRGGKIIAEDCLFTQSGGLLGFGLRNSLTDIGNHIGQAVNDHGLRAVFWPRTWLPGICRGLTADTGGLVLATRCYRNRGWIRIDGCNSYLSRVEAHAIVQNIEAVCPDVRGRLGGVSLAELFCAVTD
ncbi:hypothetical protein [uncultured Desulfovibrio sp.]|uniref:hypothetical protein n=1 Tax=uncultured Desulfovibrio sp. TaxID=167968 RepID=UPI0003B670E5|nr:hypothetical protein [uncultured Desulfovibrio sp.]